MAEQPIVLITGAAGDIGSALSQALAADYRVVGLDRPGSKADTPLLEADIASEASVRRAFGVFRQRYGSQIASVVHLAAYFDFSGEDNALYQQVNVEGTRALLRALQDLEVEQFVYSGTMLVHEPTAPGERIDESRPIGPKWAYPRSKAEAEEVIRAERGRIPTVLLHLAGVYDERRCVPTLAQQIARIYERDFKSHLYAGNPDAGQALLHKEDMIDAFRRAVERRQELPAESVILIGEPQTPGYDQLQDHIGRLLHGEEAWTTLQLPKPVTKLGALLEDKLEPVIPDAIDQGEKPFIRPFMVEMADDHYALDITRARQLLGWQPRHRILGTLPALIASLKRDPVAWYEDNKVTPPAWMTQAEDQGANPDALRTQYELARRSQHAEHLWAPFFNIVLGIWLVSGPPMLALQSMPMVISDMTAGAALTVFAALSLSWRLTWARWACALIGSWLLLAPLVFWAPTAAGYLNDTLIGMLVVGFAVLTPPEPGVSPVAAMTGPESPPGWSFNPSSWTQRLPIIVLALVGLQLSRYMAAYQLGHIDSVWDPLFAGSADPKNGTEEIITSSVSQAWPVPDAGLGALTYALEIVTGIVGSQRRWRTMPWLVLAFGAMIVPLGAVSIFFIIIQPIWIGTWCLLCLIAAAAMLVQIPYSLDELVATTQFLWRRKRAGHNLLRVMMVGDTDEGSSTPEQRAFEKPPAQVLRDMWSGGVGLPWNLALSMAIGVWLMCSRLTLDAQGSMAHTHHLIGSLALTVSVIACAEVARSLRFVNIVLAVALAACSFAWADGTLQLVTSLGSAAALAVLSLPRGSVLGRYGAWNRYIL